MPTKKNEIIKSLPKIFQRPSKAIKLAEEFAKADPALEELKKEFFERKQKKDIQPLIEQSQDGKYTSSLTKEKFVDLVQLIINVK